MPPAVTAEEAAKPPGAIGRTCAALLSTLFPPLPELGAAARAAGDEAKARFYEADAGAEPAAAALVSGRRGKDGGGGVCGAVRACLFVASAPARGGPRRIVSLNRPAPGAVDGAALRPTSMRSCEATNLDSTLWVA